METKKGLHALSTNKQPAGVARACPPYLAMRCRLCWSMSLRCVLSVRVEVRPAVPAVPDVPAVLGLAGTVSGGRGGPPGRGQPWMLPFLQPGSGRLRIAHEVGG